MASKGAMTCAKLKQLTQSIAKHNYRTGFQWIRISLTMQPLLSNIIVLHEFYWLSIMFLLFLFEMARTAVFNFHAAA